MLKKVALVLVAVSFLAGCADHRNEAKKALEGTLRVGYKVEFGELTNYPGAVVCGEYNPIGRFGLKEGPAPFIYQDGKAKTAFSEDDLAIFCSEDPAAEFQARFGIDPLDQGNTTLATVREDLIKLDQALQQYLADNLNFPITNQGLQALVVASEVSPKPSKFREGGYIKDIPTDPWGRPYLYTSEEKLRTEVRDYFLKTLGKDGAEGGEGENADISNLQLKYLSHLATLNK